MDGMLAHPVPSVAVREMGADRVIAVHLKGRWATTDGPRHLFDVIGQCFAIAQEKCEGLWRPGADVIVEPDVNGFKYDDFEQTAALLRAGESVMRAAMPEVRNWLAEPQPAPVDLPAAKKPRKRPLQMPNAEPAME